MAATRMDFHHYTHSAPGRCAFLPEFDGGRA
ncbi:hypothetical protein SAMN06295900_11389 [Trinickia caryophylli]|uniref:Uncharacterized protein n=1 Tax=Trinickia caryophylli TaxID=28094 RepID=A0A1X7G3D2_TRICW|nr:hypothetical protein SAMN06295900_11389 [Trinickia caryophylli]